MYVPAFRDTNQTNKKEDIKRLAEEEEKDTMSINRREDKGRKEIVHMETEAKDEGRQMENKDSKERHKQNLIGIIRKTMNTEDNEVMKRWPLRAWTDSAYRFFLIRSMHYYSFQFKFRFSEKATKN